VGGGLGQGLESAKAPVAGFDPLLTFARSARRSLSADAPLNSFFPATVAVQLCIALAVWIFSIASLTVKLAALARGGNSLKVARTCPTIA